MFVSSAPAILIGHLEVGGEFEAEHAVAADHEFASVGDVTGGHFASPTTSVASDQ